MIIFRFDMLWKDCLSKNIVMKMIKQEVICIYQNVKYIYIKNILFLLYLFKVLVNNNVSICVYIYFMFEFLVDGFLKKREKIKSRSV